MRPLQYLLLCALAVLVGYGLTSPLAAQSFSSHSQAAPGSGYWSDPANWLQQFVPDNQLFWDNSKNWPTNYGPAYRDTVGMPSQMLACSEQYALCFHSGPDPYPVISRRMGAQPTACVPFRPLRITCWSQRF